MDVVTHVRESTWREFLSQAEGASIFQSPELMSVYQQTTGCRTQVVAAELKGETTALMASVILSRALRRFSGVTARAVCVGGPIGDPRKFSSLLAAHDGEAAKHAILSQIRNLQAPSEQKAFKAGGYAWMDHLNFLIDLRGGEQAVFEHMSKARRKGISRAERFALELVDLGLQDSEASYSLLRETYRRAAVPLVHESLFRNAQAILGPKRLLWSVGARRSGSLCAVRFILHWGKILYDWYAGSNSEGHEAHADEWLVGQIFRRGIEQGCETFDFGGAGKPSEPYGPREFKRRFGGHEINPGRFEKVYRPIAHGLSKAAFKAWRFLQ